MLLRNYEIVHYTVSPWTSIKLLKTWMQFEADIYVKTLRKTYVYYVTALVHSKGSTTGLF